MSNRMGELLCDLVCGCRNAKWRERRGRVDKDVRRTDRQQPFYHETRGLALKQLRSILLTYVQYNNDLGYCQVSASCNLHTKSVV